MIYSHSAYKRFFYLPIGWILVVSLLQLKEINILLQGNADGKILFRIFLSLLFFPILYVVFGLYFKSISIVTNDMGIQFKSWFKKVHLKWEEINEVKRYGERIKIHGKYRTFYFSTSITPSSSSLEIDYKENIYKQSALLKEIFLKVKNVPFKNFPKGTFDELKIIKSSQKTNA